MSRLPIRQALLVLQREGLVFLDHGRGAAVAPLDIKFISDVFDFRAIVDGYVAAALAARPDFDPGVLGRIMRDGREASARGEPRRDLVMEFHTAQYEAVGNQVLSRIMRPLLDHVQRVVTFVQSAQRAMPAQMGGPGKPPRNTLPGLRPQSETWDEHEAILEAITSGQVGRARTLARRHVDQVKQVAVAYLVSAAPGSVKRTERRRSRDATAEYPSGLSITFDSVDLLTRQL